MNMVVKKDIGASGEGKADLANILSLLQQLMSMEQAEAKDTKEQAPVIESDDKDEDDDLKVEAANEEEDNEDEAMQLPPKNINPKRPEDNLTIKSNKARKALQQGNADASTGSADAEDKIDDLPEDTEENTTAVATKMLEKALRLISGRKGVAKSGTDQSVIKALNRKVEQQGAILNEIVEALQVVKSADVKETAPKPVAQYGSSIQDVLKALVDATQKNVVETNDRESVRKSLGAGIAALLTSGK